MKPLIGRTLYFYQHKYGLCPKPGNYQFIPAAYQNEHSQSIFSQFLRHTQESLRVLLQ